MSGVLTYDLSKLISVQLDMGIMYMNKVFHQYECGHGYSLYSLCMNGMGSVGM